MFTTRTSLLLVWADTCSCFQSLAHLFVKASKINIVTECMEAKRGLDKIKNLSVHRGPVGLLFSESSGPTTVNLSQDFVMISYTNLSAVYFCVL